MRLWHEDLIPDLPTSQLLGQHRELCALRGLSWGKKHSVVNYVFAHPYAYLYVFHLLVMDEMERRGYSVDPLWKDIYYRGKRIGYDYQMKIMDIMDIHRPIYPEHNESYWNECCINLKNKGVDLKH